MSNAMAITIAVLVLVVAPLVAGTAAGFRVRPGDGYRQAPFVAWICCLGLVGVALIVGDAATPQSACGHTGCDTNYGLGAIAGGLIMFGPAFLGVWLGRRVRRKHRAPAV